MVHVRELLLEEGSSPYAKWFNGLPANVAAKITVSILRMQQGNFSNIKWFKGIGEYKINFGPGWRVYLAKEGEKIIILIGGGSKTSQKKDISRALELWKDYKHRKRTHRR
ncbi:MAG: type II toxin-antitoxin system RelE/ParE family toxin [Deltaproteobacteria bacterium]|nr:type II toxin-antitoxin system RelE/ParE family toxin [Deltaproteobacteria bacterium]